MARKSEKSKLISILNKGLVSAVLELNLPDASKREINRQIKEIKREVREHGYDVDVVYQNVLLKGVYHIHIKRREQNA